MLAEFGLGDHQFGCEIGNENAVLLDCHSCVERNPYCTDAGARKKELDVLRRVKADEVDVITGRDIQIVRQCGGQAQDMGFKFTVGNFGVQVSKRNFVLDHEA